MIVFGIDISKSKGQAYAIVKDETVIQCGIEESISRTFSHLPEKTDCIAWEKAFLKKNPATTIALAEVTGSLIAVCELNGHKYQIILGEHWQKPIKRLFGLNSKPHGISEHDWKKLKYRKFRVYLSNFLSRSIRISDLTEDEVAAACIALHIARREKTRQLIQKATRRIRKKAPKPNPQTTRR